MSARAHVSIIRRIAATVLCISLAGYLGFLLYSQYRSQIELQSYYLTRMQEDTGKRATAVSYFFSERLDDMNRLADSRELSVYFENMGLGMSMEYGLAASLAEARLALARYRDDRRIGGSHIYTRLLFLDETGTPLIDTAGEPGSGGESRAYWRKYRSRKQGSLAYFVEGRDHEGIITLSLPYYFKDRYAGQLLARLSPEMVYDQFITGSAAGSSHSLTALTSSGQYLYTTGQEGAPLTRAQLPPPASVAGPGPHRFSLSGHTPETHDFSVFTTHVAGTPFSIVTFIPEGGSSPAASPKVLLIITGAIGIMILIGAGMLILTSVRNALLNTRLAEISIREQAIADKNRSLRKLTAALEQSANSVIISGTDGTIEYTNPYFTELSGYGRDEVIGSNVATLPIYEESGFAFGRMRDAIGARESWDGELLLRRKNGEQYWEHLSISPVRNDDGEVISCVAIGQDITERKNAEEFMLRMNQELEERVRERTAALEKTNLELELAYRDIKAAQSQMLQQEKMASIGQLAAGVAHEINNPMGFILSNLNTLGKYSGRLLEFINAQAATVAALPGADPQQEFLAAERNRLKIDLICDDLAGLIAESVDGGERVKQIVQNLKSFARLHETETKKADLNEGLESTINIVWNELKYKARLVKEYGPIPPTVCNAGQLNQVFLNMLVNAGQAIESQGEIRVRTWHDDTDIFVRIADSGCGIPEDKLGRIFEPFFTTKAVGKGTGLGLSISYDIIKKHNGDIDVTSETGTGSAFTVRIPIVAEEPPATA